MKLFDLLPLAKPYQQLRRSKWDKGKYIPMPESLFDFLLIVNIENKVIAPIAFDLDDLLADDWSINQP